MASVSIEEMDQVSSYRMTVYHEGLKQIGNGSAKIQCCITGSGVQEGVVKVGDNDLAEYIGSEIYICTEQPLMTHKS